MLYTLLQQLTSFWRSNNDNNNDKNNVAIIMIMSIITTIIKIRRKHKIRIILNPDAALYRPDSARVPTGPGGSRASSDGMTCLGAQTIAETCQLEPTPLRIDMLDG